MKPIIEEITEGAWWRTEDAHVWRQVWQEYDPGLYEAVRGRYEHPGTPHELKAKPCELIVVAVDAAIAYPYPFIDMHVHKAFDEGATVLEILEAINVAGEICGLHTVNQGTRALVRVVREREKKNEPVPEFAPRAIPTSSGSLSTLRPKEQVWQRLLKKYDPARAAGLEAWTERVLAQKELDIQTRQLIIIAVASVVKLMPSSFEAQVELALEVGCTVQQIVEAVLRTGQLEGIHTVEYGLTMLDNVVEGRKS